MAVLGPAVWYALWPWVWHDTLARLEWWFDYHFNHVYYNMEFLHENYHSAPSPRMYLPVMVIATVPAITRGTSPAVRLRRMLPPFRWVSRSAAARGDRRGIMLEAGVARKIYRRATSI